MDGLKVYLDKRTGQKLQPLWEDVHRVTNTGIERLDYPTQKPEALFEHLIKTSSNENDIVADFFCVRKGTRVFKVAGPTISSSQVANESQPHPFIPPRYRGGKENDGLIIPPRNRGGKEGGVLVPAMLINTNSIESIAIGDCVLGHDGLPHRVTRTFSRQYTGKMIGIKREDSNEVLWVTADHKVLTRKSLRNLGGMRDWSGIIPGNYTRAKELRKEMTPPEKIVWEMVRGNKCGVNFRRQHPIGSYIPDFYSHEINMAIEVDGAKFHSSKQDRFRDSIRDKLLQQRLIRVVRIPAKTVLTNLSETRRLIQAACNDFFSPENAEWIKAGELKKFDLVFCAIQNNPTLAHSSISGKANPTLLSLPEIGEGKKTTYLSSLPDIGEGKREGFLIARRITGIIEQTTEEQVFDIEVEDAHSFITETCVIHNYGLR